MSERNPSGNKKRIFIFIGVMIVSVTVCMCAVLAAAFSLITEGVYEFPDEKAVTYSEITEVEDIMQLLTDACESVTDTSRTFVNTRTELSVDDDGITSSSGNTALLEYVKDDLLSLAFTLYPQNHDGSFGDGVIARPDLNFNAGLCSSAVCKLGKTENGETVDTDKYYITAVLYCDDGYDMSSADKIAAEMKSRLSEQCIISNESITPPITFTLEACVDAETRRLEYIYTDKEYSVSLNAEFTGALSAFGKDEIAFDYRVCEKYEYTYAGISFEESTVSVEPGKSVQLSVAAVINDDAQYSVSFASSNEKIASVDEMGFVTGVTESSEPAEITVTLEYLGNTYTDTCLAYVGTAVEKIKISDSSLKLSLGETARLGAKITPSNATDSRVIWISENENVVRVSDDGTVTTVSAGEAVIIAVSNDGHFRDSCTVTVSDNAGGDEK